MSNKKRSSKGSNIARFSIVALIIVVMILGSGKYLMSKYAQKAGINEIAVQPRFSDVPSDHPAYSAIETIYGLGITSGCTQTPLSFCPQKAVKRSELAIFLLRSMKGGSYTPPVVTKSSFKDVPSSRSDAAWIENIAAEKITSGCDNSNNFCPDGEVTRAQMAIFLLKSKNGSSYVPPKAVGLFSDVPVSHWAAPWIEQLKNDGITNGCGNNNFCPDGVVTRSDVATFLVATFNLGKGMCTKDVSSCPDGSKVGRTGPNCEFVCPPPVVFSPPNPPAGCKYTGLEFRDPAKLVLVCASPSPTIKPSPSIFASPSPSSIQGSSYGVKFFSTTKSCASASFLNFKYTCNDGRVGDSIGKCITLSTALESAYKTCGTKPL